VQAKQPKYNAGEVNVSNDWPAIAIQITVATIFSGVIAYVATNPEQLVQAQAAVAHVYAPTPPVPAPPAVPDEPVPVQVANPFDTSEIFQFPAGTSDTDAHVAVAKLLLQRARDRQDLWVHSDHRFKRRANHLQPDAGAELTGTGVGSAPAVSSPGAPQS
jgi:hypothetical protein